MKTKNFCPVCVRDANGNQRELLLENGTKCHGCGFTLETTDDPVEVEFLCRCGCTVALAETVTDEEFDDGLAAVTVYTCKSCGTEVTR